jgi:hypothetical protein
MLCQDYTLSVVVINITFALLIPLAIPSTTTTFHRGSLEVVSNNT